VLRAYVRLLIPLHFETPKHTGCLSLGTSLNGVAATTTLPQGADVAATRAGLYTFLCNKHKPTRPTRRAVSLSAYDQTWEGEAPAEPLQFPQITTWLGKSLALPRE
jgi:hypothetical protein